MSVVEIINGITGHPDRRMAQPVNLAIEQGEQIAIVGDNGAGKSRLVDIITGRCPLRGDSVHYNFAGSPYSLASDNIRRIEFRDSYGDADGSYYLQQRWNQHDIDPATPTVGQLLDKAFDMAEKSVKYSLAASKQAVLHTQRVAMRNLLNEIFDMRQFADKYIITLSSGELRRFVLTKALYSLPRMLVLESPFIGLDPNTRRQLALLLAKLISETHLQVVLVQATGEEIPPFITHVVEVNNLTVSSKHTIGDFLSSGYSSSPCPSASSLLSTPNPSTSSADVLRFRDVTIRYGDRTILNKLNWVVRKGENWALRGKNGSGKSTLLSLVCADNPQSYACDIELFGRRRGTGESIWEIKRHIGYVSPEMHRAYMRSLPAIDIVQSGLVDTVGLYVKPKQEQRQQCIEWMCRFGIDHLAERDFLKLSSGEQRLVLVCRAFVKNPDLLILDEPLHGLDAHNKQLVRQIITEYTSSPSVTLIMVSHYDEELPENITNVLSL